MNFSANALQSKTHVGDAGRCETMYKPCNNAILNTRTVAEWAQSYPSQLKRESSVVTNIKRFSTDIILRNPFAIFAPQ